MKKIILIVSLIISLIGITIVALPSILRITGLAQPIKRYLLSSLLEKKSYSINLDDFKIGLGNIEFKNVALKSNNENFSLMINSIRFLYDLPDLLRHPKDPVAALKTITLVKPYLVIRQDSSVRGESNGSKWETVKTFLRKINQKKSLKLFRVEDATIIYRKKDGARIVLGNKLNGAIRSDDFVNIELGLIGGMLSDASDQVELSARVNLSTNRLRLLARVNDYQVNESNIRDFIPSLDLRDGILNGWLLMENDSFSLNKLRCNGELNFKNFKLNYNHREIRRINFKAVIAENRLIVDSLSAKIAESDLSGNVLIKNILHPEVQARIKVVNLSLNDLHLYNWAEWHQKTTFNGEVRFRFDPAAGKAQIKIERGALNYDKIRYIKDFSATVTKTPDTVRITGFKAAIGKDNRLKGEALYLQKKSLLTISLAGKHRTGLHLIFDKLSRKTHELKINFDYHTNSGIIRGKWAYSLKDTATTLMAMTGQIQGNRKFLNIDVQNSTIPEFSARLRLANYLKRLEIEEGVIQNFPFSRFTSAPLLQSVLARTINDFRLTGPLNQLNAHILLTDRENRKNQIEVVALLNNLTGKDRSLNGLVRLKNISGNANIKFSDNYLKGQFNFGRQIKGDINIDFEKEEYLKGDIYFNQFNVVQALSDSTVKDNFRFLGSIDGHLSVSGDIQNPLVQAELSGDRFVFHDIGYYQAGLKLKANKDSINIDSLYVAINNLPIVQGKSKIDLDKNTVKGFFSGKEVDIEQLMTTFAPEKVLFTGVADYGLRVSGTLKQPNFDLDLNVEDGILDRVEFDRLSLKLRNSYKNGSSFYKLEDQVFKFDKLLIVKKDQFELSGQGEIPFNPTGNVDFYLIFKGDLFSLIPLYQPFFEKGVSDVDIHLAIGGSPESIRLSSGYLLINSGELWLKKVARHIKNISGVIEKKNDSNQVNFINVTGESGGEALTINTVRGVKLPDGKEMLPWYFKGIDLDFGVLKLETSGDGIRLNIPGLMLEGEEGRMYLSGMTENEAFYFAGPVKHPVARGTVTLYDTRLTFPFITTSKEPVSKPSVVVNFLKNINWDVHVVSGKDVVYFKEIPAYIDNVNTELYIDESSKGLYFKGILNKGTFKPTGQLSSSRGRLEYLDQTFRVDYFQAEFTESSPYPVISGQAWTTIRDSIGAVPKTIYLKLYAIDEETQQEKQQGSWENFKFKLVSADPQIGESQEQVLAYLGFSVGNIREKVTSVGGAVTEKYIFRPIFRPIERALERSLGMDLVRINSNIAKNLFYTSIGFGQNRYDKNQPLVNPFDSPTPYLFLMQSSELTVGKYITQNLFLTYTGQLVSVYDQTKPSFDINHSFGIEYRFLRNILLEIEYDRELMGYYKILNQRQYLEDVKIRLRHSFTF
ncbi:MAG: hypothetical protein GXO77_11355 [Calditrichaeota bacterium]|nr:hypothetical protein [Calditrichota bacterium]